MTVARNTIMNEGAVEWHHAYSRIVQGEFLCGMDQTSGVDFSYRRDILESLVRYQSSVLAVSVGNFVCLSNHFHVIACSRPDIVETWTDEECAWRYRLAWPSWDGVKWSRCPSDAKVNELLGDPQKLQYARRKLASISLLMAQVKQPTAKIFNAESEKTGDFWVSRFGSRRLNSDESALCCSLYCDLNQVRAGMANSLEASHPSAVKSRILAERARTKWIEENSQASFQAMLKDADHGLQGLSHSNSSHELATLFRDSWLAPIAEQGPLGTTEDIVAAEHAGQSVDVSRLVRERTGVRLPNLIVPDLSRFTRNAPIDNANQGAGQNENSQNESAKEDGVKNEAANSSGLREAVNIAKQNESPSTRTEKTRGRPPKEILYKIHNKHRHRLTRRKSDRCFIDSSWASYQRAVQALANKFLGKSQELRSTSADQDLSWRAIRDDFDAFLQSALATIREACWPQLSAANDTSERPDSSGVKSPPATLTEQCRPPPR